MKGKYGKSIDENMKGLIIDTKGLIIDDNMKGLIIEMRG